MITAHMIVKNEDGWVWYAIKSVLPYVDRFLITDTGSTDNTVKIIKSINSKKIKFNKITINSAKEITKIRQDHVNKTKSGWIWLVDGDEIYPQKTAKEIISKAKRKHSIIIVRRFDLLGDVYHHQLENIGEYELYGEKGHLVTRLMNLDKIQGLHLKGDYPNEGYYSKDGKSTQDIKYNQVYITKNKLFHTMYLNRSSKKESNIINRGKYKIEIGEKIKENLPEVFYKKRPKYVPNPLKKRSMFYEILASIITPIKNLKRKLL